MIGMGIRLVRGRESSRTHPRRRRSNGGKNYSRGGQRLSDEGRNGLSPSAGDVTAPRDGDKLQDPTRAPGRLELLRGGCGVFLRCSAVLFGSFALCLGCAFRLV